FLEGRGTAFRSAKWFQTCLGSRFLTAFDMCIGFICGEDKEKRIQVLGLAFQDTLGQSPN
ncbi:MAG: hypothetical protein WBO46_17505, partial [Caldilineaceae bacterium]